MLLYYSILSNTSYFMLYLYIVVTFFKSLVIEKCFDRYNFATFFIVLYSLFFYFFDLALLKCNFVNCLLLNMYIFVFIPMIIMNCQGINVKPCYNIVYASTLSVYIAYIYDKWMNFTYLIKTSKEVLLEVFLGMKLNGL